MYFMRNKFNMIGMVITTYFWRWPSQVLQSQSYNNNDDDNDDDDDDDDDDGDDDDDDDNNNNINIYAVFIYLFIDLWLYLHPVCHEYKIWSQVLMKEEILKAINGVCWLLLNTFHATCELCCLKINIFFSGFWIYLVFYKVSDSSLFCYMLIYSNGNWNLWLYQMKQAFFFLHWIQHGKNQYYNKRISMKEGRWTLQYQHKKQNISVKEITAVKFV